jgi:hypothetical protein
VYLDVSRKRIVIVANIVALFHTDFIEHMSPIVSNLITVFRT